ncbi:MAG: methyltransferase domain-containing protein [Culturomica sp.]|nr:methyltransferase domain-containing protein [Culturomica sp.]
MNNKPKNNTVSTIHDFDFNLICEFFLSLDRQGPGSPEMTRKALGFIEGLTPGSCIADLGCGTGGQTMTLAASTPGQITGLDLFPAFIDRFNEQARGQGVQERVQGIVGSMDALPFAEGSLDLIWCEGAIYNIGFERGLRYWRPFLKPGGYVAVTENTYFTEKRPVEIEVFWNAAYPEIDTIPNKVAVMQRAGYEFIAAFALPQTCWTENFYARLPAAQEAFLKKHAGNPVVETFIAGQREEQALFDPTHYGYVFYIAKKRE